MLALHRPPIVNRDNRLYGHHHRSVFYRTVIISNKIISCDVSSIYRCCRYTYTLTITRRIIIMIKSQKMHTYISNRTVCHYLCESISWAWVDAKCQRLSTRILKWIFANYFLSNYWLLAVNCVRRLHDWIESSIWSMVTNGFIWILFFFYSLICQSIRINANGNW